MRVLPFRDWMLLLAAVYRNCLVHLQATQALHAILLRWARDAFPGLGEVCVVRQANAAPPGVGGVVGSEAGLERSHGDRPQDTVNSDVDVQASAADNASASAGSALSEAVTGAGVAVVVGTESVGQKDVALGLLGTRRSPLDVAAAMRRGPEPDELEGLIDEGMGATGSLELGDLDGFNGVLTDADLSQLDNGKSGENGHGGETKDGERGDRAENRRSAAELAARTRGGRSEMEELNDDAAKQETEHSREREREEREAGGVAAEQAVRVLLELSWRTVGDMCHQMHVRCAKLLGARTRDGVDSNVPASKFVSCSVLLSLSLPSKLCYDSLIRFLRATLTHCSFIELFQITQAFIQAGEHVCLTSYPELRGALLTLVRSLQAITESQSLYYLLQYHKAIITKRFHPLLYASPLFVLASA